MKGCRHASQAGPALPSQPNQHSPASAASPAQAAKPAKPAKLSHPSPSQPFQCFSMLFGIFCFTINRNPRGGGDVVNTSIQNTITIWDKEKVVQNRLAKL